MHWLILVYWILSVSYTHLFSLKEGFIVDGTPGFVLQPYDEVYVRRSPGYQACLLYTSYEATRSVCYRNDSVDGFLTDKYIIHSTNLSTMYLPEVCLLYTSLLTATKVIYWSFQ